MNKEIRVITVHTITDGHVDEVKRMAATIVARVRAGEPG